jgi:hypothetical protein
MTTIGKLQCLTCAPVDYDYGYVVPLVSNAFVDDRGRAYRLIQLPDQYHFEYQTARYASGLHRVVRSQEDLEKELKFGFLTPTENPVYHLKTEIDFEDLDDKTFLENAERIYDEVEAVRAMPGFEVETHKGGLLQIIHYQSPTPSNEEFNRITDNLFKFLR